LTLRPIEGAAQFSIPTSLDHVPRRYVDLLDTRWKDKVVINLNNFMWGYAMLDLLGQEKRMDFLRRLKGLNARAQRGSSLTAQLVAAGEFQVGVSLNAHDVSRMKRQGCSYRLGQNQ
jgi:ABC-type Fe3+ transport system substrate-binding protein